MEVLRADNRRVDARLDSLVPSDDFEVVVPANTQRADFPCHLHDRNTIRSLANKVTEKHNQVTRSVVALAEQILKFIDAAVNIADGNDSRLPFLCSLYDSFDKA